MNKPISIIYEEFKVNFANLINDCGLPVCMIETLLESYLQEIKIIAKQQYELESKQYEESLRELRKGEKENEN